MLWVSANFFASLFGLTLKPIRTAFEALAKVTSVSVIMPIPEKIIFGSLSSLSFVEVFELILFIGFEMFEFRKEMQSFYKIVGG